MSLTDVTLCGKTLCSPVIAASGTFGFGGEYAGIVDMKKLGGISGKGLTLEGKYGNEGERLWETPAGLINSIGLQNPGVKHLCEVDLPWIKAQGVPSIVNVSGHSIEEYVQVLEALEEDGQADAYEINISCPNVDAGGLTFGTHVPSVTAVVSACREVATKPMIVKLSPNVTDITEIARAAEAAGADAISLINTLLGMAIDVERRRPKLARVVGGLSGPAVKPVALRMVWQCHQAVKVPLLGMGGISTGEDAIEFMLAGATAVAVGTANFVNPHAENDVLDGMIAYCERQGVKDINELIGGLQC